MKEAIFDWKELSVKGEIEPDNLDSPVKSQLRTWRKYLFFKWSGERVLDFQKLKPFHNGLGTAVNLS